MRNEIIPNIMSIVFNLFVLGAVISVSSTH